MQTQMELQHTIYDPKEMPGLAVPQVALAGRSNVGKSSLINCLAGKKKLAKISSTPGKTRSINFYFLPKQGFYLVDLPGYGYAARSKKEQQVWKELISRYFESNPSLRGVVVLLDSRLEPQALDLQLISFIRERSLELLPVLTKADKGTMSQRTRVQNIWKDLLAPSRPPVLFSAQTGRGKEALWSLLLETVGTAPSSGR